MANTYDIGDLIRISAEFKDLDDIFIDPSEVFFRVQEPDGDHTMWEFGVDPALVQDDTGEYHLDVDVVASGTWVYRVEGVGAGQSAAEATFLVRCSEF